MRAVAGGRRIQTVTRGWVRRAQRLLSTHPSDGGRDRSSYERLAVPFTFKPRLSVVEALIATVAAVVRIFVGSLLFAVWGTSSAVAWTTVRSPLGRIGALAALFVLFLLSCALLMFVVSIWVRAFAPRTR